jgi:hypothetical protein
MNYSKWVLLTLLTLGLASSSGCFGPPPDKPLTDEQKQKLNDDMLKAIELNKKS